MKPSDFKISFIGAGNVAFHLSQALFEKGFVIKQVYNKTGSKAEEIAKRVHSSAIDDLKKLDYSGDIFIFAVTDNAIPEILSQCSFTNQVLVHTAGSVEMGIFNSCSKNYGVFYPLQTFSKEKEVRFSSVPVCLEANNEETYSKLNFLADSISNLVYRISTQERLYIHIAAVFASNYTNFMYSLAYEILDNKGLNFDILKPLIEETAAKIKDLSPGKSQTGPAIRNDFITIEKHQQSLKNDPELFKIYSLLATTIQKKR